MRPSADSGVTELRQHRVVDADLLEQLGRVLAEARRRAADSDRGLARLTRRDLRERSGIAKPATARMVDVDEELAERELLRAGDLVRRVGGREHQVPLDGVAEELGHGLR